MYLSPSVENVFLRFFYLYQVIETLMARDYTDRFNKIRASFSAQNDISITQLKDFLKNFNAIVKEEPRIKNALQPACAASNLIAEKILGCLGEKFDDLDFGARVYRIRNIIFHDYQRIHHMEEDVGDFEDGLLSYLLDKKL